jgi:O-antigen/teichoic acid export membrane protein
MLSGFERLGDVGRKKIYLVFGVAVSISFIAPIIVFFAGPLISSIMFPGFAAESTQLLRRLIIIIPFVTIRIFADPFIVKFGPIKFIPILSFTALAAHLLPAIFLIPKFGLNGAVISYYVGHGATTLAWLLALIWTFKFGGDRILSVTPEAVE